MIQIKGKKVIFLLFFLSGISGLIYEVVWLRILSRIMGVTTYATATVLAAFMAGLALGSFIFGKFIDGRKDPLKIYALLQLFIAFAAITVTISFRVLPFFHKYIYEISNQNANLIVTLRVLMSFLSFLIPTTLMGGTLPVLISYLVRKEKSFGKNFSLLYGINTFGAVFGVILSGFITIGALGEWNTILIGVLINFIVGIVAFKLYKKKLKFTYEPEIRKDISVTPIDIPISSYPDNIRKIVLISILISGFTALSYEVIWARQLILFLNTSIYAFSAMLAVFLMGIAMGSICVNSFIDRLKMPLLVFGFLEFAVGALSILNLYLFPSLDNSLLFRICSPIILVFPLTFLFGAILPIASLCYTKSVNRTGTSVGILYGFNTIGNVTGSLLTGFLFISILGSSKTLILLSFVNIALGSILLWSEPNKLNNFKLKYLLIIPFVIFFSLGFKGKDPFLGVIEKRISRGAKNYKIFYNQECIEGTVTSYVRNGSKGLLINGVGQTKLCTETKLMAHLPIMLAKEPKNLLIICFGMGTTVRSASIYDDLNITSVDLAPELYGCFKYYHNDAEEILNRKNLNTVAADGRNFLLLSSDKYDVITVDPSPPIYSAGTVNLYTQEFFSLCKKHLTPGGVMCLWFPFGARDVGATTDDVMYILSTFYSVFPNMTVWKGPHGWGIYVIGTFAETDIDKTKIEKAFDNQNLIKDLSEYDNSCVTSSQLLNLLIINNDNVAMFINDTCIITDNYPYTEFPLWRYILSRKKKYTNR